jgi:hypothetical protein
LPNKLSVFGLILLLAGAVCLAVGEYRLGDVNAVPIEQQYSVWSLAVNLTQRTTWYGIDIQSSDDWGKPFGRGDFTKPMPVNVTIASPAGDVTRLQLFLYGERSTSPYYQLGAPPTIVEVKYQNVSAGLAVDYSTPHIRFTPKQDGPYNVTVLKDGFWSAEPPDYILFLKEVTPDRETYSLLATGGGVVCTLGGIIFIVSLFKNRNGKRKNRK